MDDESQHLKSKEVKEFNKGNLESEIEEVNKSSEVRKADTTNLEEPIENDSIKRSNRRRKQNKRSEKREESQNDPPSDPSASTVEEHPIGEWHWKKVGWDSSRRKWIWRKDYEYKKKCGLLRSIFRHRPGKTPQKEDMERLFP